MNRLTTILYIDYEKLSESRENGNPAFFCGITEKSERRIEAVMSGYAIRVAGERGAVFSCGPGDSVLAGALRAGLAFPYECNSGGCGACQFELVAGDVVDRWPAAPGISDRQRGRGRRLACQSEPQGECEIKVTLGEADAAIPRPARHEVRFTGRRSLTADMAEFTFAAATEAHFLPGQFAMLDLPGVAGSRAYSMSNTANAAGEWRFVAKRVPGGAGTAFLFDQLEAGAGLMLDGPFGGSFLRSDAPRDIVCIAGGSGLSPVLSILRGIAAEPRLAGRRVTLFHGVRQPDDACAAAELARIPGLAGRVELIAAVSDEGAPGAAEWSGARGMIHDVVRSHLSASAPDFEFYFCGPPPMTDAVHRLLLLEAKVPASQLHFDRFY